MTQTYEEERGEVPKRRARRETADMDILHPNPIIFY